MKGEEGKIERTRRGREEKQSEKKKGESGKKTVLGWRKSYR